MSSTSQGPSEHDRTITRRSMLAATAGVAIGVGTVLPGSAPASAQTAPPPPRLRFLRNANAGNPAAGATNRWQTQVLQGDRTRPSLLQVPEQFVYATAVRRVSDTEGVTQCLRPADVPSSWLLTDRSGRTITRNGGDDTALDVGNPSFQRASADFLVEKCRANGASEPWTGVHHDEVNAIFGWGWAGAVPARYPTTAGWQSALAGYVSYLARRLDAAGFTLLGNLGANTPAGQGWYGSLVGDGMVPSLEYFVCGEHRPDGSTANYADPADWVRQVEFVESAEAHRSGNPSPVTPRGTRIVVHERQDSEAGIRYSLASYLLASTGNGASTYGSDVDYDATTSPYPDCYAEAQRLGVPAGPRTRITADMWSRYFTHGWVLVNTGTSTASYSGITVGPRSATIGITSRS